jgi:hypothetical protein
VRLDFANALALLGTLVSITTAETLSARNARDGGTRRTRVVACLLFASTSAINIGISLATSVWASLPLQVYWLTRHLRNAHAAYKNKEIT